MNQSTIAALALVISLLVAAWEVGKYVFLDAGRVRVRLHAGLLTDYRLAQSRKSWANVYKMAGDRGWHLEVAVIEVENPGRTAVTISDVSLDLGRPRWWRLGRHTIGMPGLDAPGASNTDSGKRLEPFDRVMYVFDIWRGLSAEKEDWEASRPFRVRGSVRVAGRRRRPRSPWRKGWLVKEGQLSFADGEVEIGMAAYRSLRRHTNDYEDPLLRLAVIPSALAIRERFPRPGPAPTADQIEEIIEKNNHSRTKPAPESGLIAYFVAEELAPHYRDGVKSAMGHVERPRPATGETQDGAVEEER